MNGKTIRQSFAILTLGLAVMATGCRNHVKEARDLAAWEVNRATYEASLTPVTAGRISARVTNATMDVHTIDRALTYNEIRSQYNKATADEFVRQGLDR